MAEKLEQKTFAEWAPIFEEYDVPGEKIYGVIEAINHPQAGANNYAQPVQYPDRVVNFPAPPIQISTLFDPAPRTVAPKIGEHSREVLTQYGFSADEIETLIAGGAVKAI
jgi:crotonobetainyl-CoA:carnitine CoA-transferase CaiB-like acyl-CoA transferase